MIVDWQCIVHQRVMRCIYMYMPSWWDDFDLGLVMGSKKVMKIFSLYKT